MKEYEISDYGIFSSAISTTNTLNNNISTAQTSYGECRTVISNESVFMGPIAEACVLELDSISSIMTELSGNFTTISKYLTDTATTYKTGDQNASNNVQLRLSGVNTTGSTQLTGSSNEEQIWNYLTSKGISPAGVAGIMGNLQQESGLRPDNVQNGMGYEDADYVAGIKNGTISRESFINDSRGFGIAQWTYPTRKAALYDTLGPENIDSLSGQLEFMYNEMGSDLTNKLANSSSVSDATDTFQYTYERAGTPNMSARQSNASSYYNKYANS